jgi:hypothetical protein
MAGHEGLELRNVVANYPFERSHRFAGIQANSGHRDHSRLSCDVEDPQLRASCREIALAHEGLMEFLATQYIFFVAIGI